MCENILLISLSINKGIVHEKQNDLILISFEFGLEKSDHLLKKKFRKTFSSFPLIFNRDQIFYRGMNIFMGNSKDPI